MKKRSLFIIACAVFVMALLLTGCPTEPDTPAPTVQSIVVKTGPEKTEYEPNDELELSGLVITVNWSNETTNDVAWGEEGLTATPDDGSGLEAGTPVVVLTYGGKTVELPIIVADHVIDSEADLLAFAAAVNGQTVDSFLYAIQTADITLTSAWTPMATTTDDGGVHTGGFHGVYDGGGNTITGLTITNTATQGAGFFSGLAGADTVVKNLKFANVSVSSSTDNATATVAGIIADQATLSNIEVLSGSVSGKKYVGGVVGKMLKTGTVDGTKNNATITGDTYNIGGIVGGAYYDQDTTGTAARVPFLIKNAENTGDVSGPYAVGGIVGLARSVSLETVSNSGAVTSNVSGASVGGIAGDFGNGAKIDGAVNSGDVTKTNAGGSYGVGGIVGWIRNNVSATYNNNIISVVKNAHNTGAVSSDNSYGVGGVAGAIYWAATIENSSNAGAVTNTSGDATGGLIGNIQYDTNAKLVEGQNIITLTNNEVETGSTVTAPSDKQTREFLGHFPGVEEGASLDFTGNKVFGEPWTEQQILEAPILGAS